MENIKLTEEEIKQIQELQQSQAALVQELGQISLSEINLGIRKDQAEDFLNELRVKEEEIGKSLNEKYGNGSIDLSTGEFIPTPEQTEE